MTLHLRELNIDNLLTVFRDLPADELALWKVCTGREFNPVTCAIAALESPGFHYIIHNGDQPLAGAGFYEQRHGVYRTWMLSTSLAWEYYGEEMTAVVKGAISDIIAQGVAHRVETITLADRKRARDWYPKIGLQYESTQIGYGINGEDAVVYVALRGTEKV